MYLHILVLQMKMKPISNFNLNSNYSVCIIVIYSTWICLKSAIDGGYTSESYQIVQPLFSNSIKGLIEVN